MPTWKDVSPEEMKRLENMSQNKQKTDISSKICQPKYRNTKTRGFHSKKEADRYDELVLMQKQGIIRNLRCQVPYVLLPPFRHKGKWYSGIKYFADFVYEENGIEITEDSKSAGTSKNKVYRLKLQLLLAQNPYINFLET